jgi:ankyrin repeat protein
MNVNIKSTRIQLYKEKAPNTFFSSLNPNFITDLNHKAGSAYDLYTATPEYLLDIQDEFCLDREKLVNLGHILINMFSDSPNNSNSLESFIKFKEYQMIYKIISETTYFNFGKIFDLIIEQYTNNQEIIIDVNTQDMSGNTLLMWLCSEKKVDQILQLIDMDICDYNIVNNKDSNALHISIMSGLDTCVKALIQTKKCDINMVDALNRTPLVLCCYQSRNKSFCECIDMLIDYEGCDLNKADNEGTSPLIMCCASKLANHVNKLIDSGRCLYDHRNNENKTALYYTINNNLDDCSIKLIRNNADVNFLIYDSPLFYECIERNKSNILDELIKRKDLNYNLQNSQGYTTLMLCCYHNNFEWIDKLIEMDVCDYNIQNYKGDTALHKCRFNHLKKYMIKMIDTQKADYTIKNHLGQSILEWCSRSS